MMSRATISEILLDAIEQLRPALPSLLGSDCTIFVAQLEISLAGERESPVWELFEKYPAANERLQEILERMEGEEDIIRGGLGLYGDPQLYGKPHLPILKHSLLLYRCETGLHDVTADQIEERDAIGNALCPQHGIPMIKITNKENEPNQKQV
jgi:hypothetical protein